MLFPQEHKDSSKSPSLHPAGPQGKSKKAGYSTWKKVSHVRCHVVDILCDFLSPLFSGHKASAPPPPSPPLPHGK